MDNINARLRTVERGLEKAELREKQLIIMFKLITEKVHSKPGLTTRDIIEYMEQLVNKNTHQTYPDTVVRDSTDLIGELIKKGDKPFQ